MTNLDLDVIVVGGGLAGLTAALRSAERGARVTVFEQGNEPLYPCNSRLAMGFFTIAGLDMTADPAMLKAAIQRVTHGEADPDLVSSLCQFSTPAFKWLIGQGVKFIRFGKPTEKRPLLTPINPLRPGLNWRGRGADSMLRHLEQRLIETNGQIMRGHRALELVCQDNRCTGLIVNNGHAQIEFKAKAVILADGGFQSNPDLLGQYITTVPKGLLQRNAGVGQGDCLLMAQAAGAKLTQLTDFYGHVQSRSAMENPDLWPYPTVDFPISAGLIVDENGDRFCDEGIGGIHVANEIAKLKNPAGAVAIIDSAIWNGPAKRFLIPANPNLVNQGALIKQAESLTELAQLLGINSGALEATVAQYNKAVETNHLNHLAPSRTTQVFQALPILTAPFFGLPVSAGITYTMGGIAINGRSQVKHQNGDIISGLYAAGGATGGHEGGKNSGYTGGLAKALTFGFIAANDICDQLGFPAT